MTKPVLTTRVEEIEELLKKHEVRIATLEKEKAAVEERLEHALQRIANLDHMTSILSLVVRSRTR